MGRARALCHAAAIALAVYAPSAGAADKLSKRERAAIAMTPEAIADLAEVRNDPLETVVRISTEPFYKSKSGLLALTSGDKFVRVFIDKKTGTALFQIYAWTQYLGEWQFFDRVNYETPDGPQPAKTRRVSERVLDCTRYGCSKQEDITFEVPEAVVRAVSAEARAGVDASWQFRIAGRFEGGETTGILKTEMAGALIAAEREIAKLQK